MVVVAAAQGSGDVVVPESQNVRVAALVAQSVHAVVGAAAQGSGYAGVAESQNVHVAALDAQSVRAVVGAGGTMVMVEVVGELLGLVCHHCQRLHLWVLQERAPLGWREATEGSG